MFTAVELLAEWGYTGNDQYDPATERLFVKSTDGALRTRGGFQWPWIGGTVKQPGATKHDSPCPEFEGDGVSVATTWNGAKQGGHRLSTVLLVAVPVDDVLAEDDDKARVRSAGVLAVVDWQREARRKGAAKADLHGANLNRADLYRAFFSGADLREADLRKADLSGAYFCGAYLSGADLNEANLNGAYLSGADLYGADLYGADFTEALWDDTTVWPTGYTPAGKVGL